VCGLLLVILACENFALARSDVSDKRVATIPVRGTRKIHLEAPTPLLKHKNQHAISITGRSGSRFDRRVVGPRKCSAGERADQREQSYEARQWKFVSKPLRHEIGIREQ